MPITITQPLDGNVIGPGFPIGAQTDIVGPLPADSHWHVQVLGGTTSETPIIGWDFALEAADQHKLFQQIGHEANQINSEQPYVAPGSNVRVVVTIVRGIFDPVVDEGSTTAKWDPVGLAWTIPTQGQGQGGFTDQDRVTIDTTENATTETLPGQIAPAVSHLLGIADLVLGFPVNRLATFECRVLVGRGSLTRSGGGFPVNAFGFRWRVVSVPPGFGARDGAVKEYFERLAQFVQINRDAAGDEYIENLVDVTTDGGKLAWSWNNLPDQVLYDITPGVQIEFCWLLV